MQNNIVSKIKFSNRLIYQIKIMEINDLEEEI